MQNNGSIVAVVGSRIFTDYELLSRTLDEKKITKIISGGACGADAMAERYAREKGIELVVFEPDWSKYGKRAGVLRNGYIIRACDEVVAFWDGSSPGTKSSISFAEKYGKKITVIIFP